MRSTSSTPYQDVTPDARASARLRVGIDARKIEDGGIGSYLKYLIQGFLKNSAAELLLYGDEKKLKRYFPTLPVEGFYASTNSISAYRTLKQRTSLSSLEVFHAPHYVGVTSLPVPLVMTVHDMIHITHPERFFYPLVARYLMRRAITAANGVIAVSRATKNNLERELSGVIIPPVTVIAPPLGEFDDDVLVGKGNFSERVDYQFLCVVSSNKPHKGLATILSIWEKLPRSATLVVAGRGVAGVESLLPNVKIIGEVSPSQLRELYCSSDWVVIPSVEEGFGYVMAEAHKAGVPVIIRPVPALLEQLLEHDACAADFSEESLLDEIKKVTGVRRKITGLQSPFSPSTIASQTEAFYRVVRQ